MELPVLPPEQCHRLELLPDGTPGRPVTVLKLDGRVPAGTVAAVRAAGRSRVVIGVLDGAWPQAELLHELAVTLAPRQVGLPPAAVCCEEPWSSAARIEERVRANPVASCVLVDLLRLTADQSAEAGLVTESLAYSMLLAGAEFRAWRRRHPVRVVPDTPGPPVAITRVGDELDIVLDRPARRNAFSAGLRDGLCEALALPAWDESVRRVRLRGAGPCFSSGGDLDEFGQAGDPGLAHLVRLERSAGLAVHRVRDRVSAELHGACSGAGVEVPAFAGHVLARRGTTLCLPELGMGLVPGAGGTVSVPHRIGRWRTAWMVLSGLPIDAPTALEWGLVDVIS